MPGSERISGLSKVIILVDKSDVDTNRTRLTVVAINAFPGSFGRRECAYNRIIESIFGLFVIREQLLYFVNALRTRKNCQNSRLVEGVAYALVYCESLAERR